MLGREDGAGADLQGAAGHLVRHQADGRAARGAAGIGGIRALVVGGGGLEGHLDAVGALPQQHGGARVGDLAAGVANQGLHGVAGDGAVARRFVGEGDASDDAQDAWRAARAQRQREGGAMRQQLGGHRRHRHEQTNEQCPGRASHGRNHSEDSGPARGPRREALGRFCRAAEAARFTVGKPLIGKRISWHGTC